LFDRPFQLRTEKKPEERFKTVLLASMVFHWPISGQLASNASWRRSFRNGSVGQNISNQPHGELLFSHPIDFVVVAEPLQIPPPLLTLKRLESTFEQSTRQVIVWEAHVCDTIRKIVDVIKPAGRRSALSLKFAREVHFFIKVLLCNTK
jgi:hypothetical protein